MQFRQYNSIFYLPKKKKPCYYDYNYYIILYTFGPRGHYLTTPNPYLQAAYIYIYIFFKEKGCIDFIKTNTQIIIQQEQKSYIRIYFSIINYFFYFMYLFFKLFYIRLYSVFIDEIKHDIGQFHQQRLKAPYMGLLHQHENYARTTH